MLTAYPVQDILMAVGLVLSFALGVISGNQR